MRSFYYWLLLWWGEGGRLWVFGVCSHAFPLSCLPPEFCLHTHTHTPWLPQTRGQSRIFHLIRGPGKCFPYRASLTVVTGDDGDWCQRAKGMMGTKQSRSHGMKDRAGKCSERAGGPGRATGALKDRAVAQGPLQSTAPVSSMTPPTSWPHSALRFGQSDGKTQWSPLFVIIFSNY